MKLRSLALFCFIFLLKTCEAQATHQAVINWGASSTSGVTYNIYRAPGTKNADGSITAGTFSVIKNQSGLTFTDTPLAADSSFCWKVTALKSGLESSSTNTACGTTNADPPQPPSGTLTITIQ